MSSDRKEDGSERGANVMETIAERAVDAVEAQQATEAKAVAVDLIRERMAQYAQQVQGLMQTEQQWMAQLEGVRERRLAAAGAHQALAALVG
ncbi:MAG: hypothetical protein KDC47_05935 [Flavobacteriaceae bacterium]|nr:hypothetical protein [Flavobacteriaceae bacterium]